MNWKFNLFIHSNLKLDIYFGRNVYGFAKKLSIEIEEKRCKLNKLGEEQNLDSIALLKASTELDILINKFHNIERENQS
ncbi:hypothetical protein GCM10010912_14170 [Paenibacillus albidus]|uniref:Aspartyl-phosphate phosphatase Spo0E family protein n=1 Tax=Paenibacillus albidus TaxID=2041023 RepID=A0A917FDY0_9BACL|nr:aspartyl-phosphate phosphatase Spo0E family protein [Paenibacillus albidus]GGF70097.1 hypothetical protein GCM10010912_14170 [Paenibacillus albidus]